MPNCFHLVPKGQTEPVVLARVDEAMCEHFGVPCDAKRWYHDWYDCIGFRLALGHSFNKIMTDCKVDAEADEYSRADMEGAAYWGHMYEIAKWLSENYTADAWYESSRMGRA